MKIELEKIAEETVEELLAYVRGEDEEAEADGLEKVRVKYSFYKNSYRSCLTVEDTYNPETKTVEIFVTAEQKEEIEKCEVQKKC